MADVIDDLADKLRRLVGGGVPSTLVSPAPGGGPEADRESNRPRRGGRIGEHITRGKDAEGYGGHGDAVQVVDDPDADARALVTKYVRAAQRKGLHQPKPEGRIRLSQAFSPEAHIGRNWQYASGPFSLFDGTMAAPSAGNSVVQIPVTLPASANSPVLLLNRYPGALYMSVFVRSFSFMPTASTMTGIQECWFTDAGGAVVGLGIYNPAAVSSAIFQNIGALCSSPLTDPGTAQLGTITVNNIGIATPVSVRWQLTVSYVAFYADPWFNGQMVVPPTPAELAEALGTMGAQGF